MEREREREREMKKRKRSLLPTNNGSFGLWSRIDSPTGSYTQRVEETSWREKKGEERGFGVLWLFFVLLRRCQDQQCCPKRRPLLQYLTTSIVYHYVRHGVRNRLDQEGKSKYHRFTYGTQKTKRFFFRFVRTKSNFVETRREPICFNRAASITWHSVFTLWKTFERDIIRHAAYSTGTNGTDVNCPNELKQGRCASRTRLEGGGSLLLLTYL